MRTKRKACLCQHLPPGRLVTQETKGNTSLLPKMTLLENLSFLKAPYFNLIFKYLSQEYCIVKFLVRDAGSVSSSRLICVVLIINYNAEIHI